MVVVDEVGLPFASLGVFGDEHFDADFGEAVGVGAPADDDLVATEVEEVCAGEGVAVDEGVVEDGALEGGLVWGVEDDLVAVHGFDGGGERGGEVALADFADAIELGVVGVGVGLVWDGLPLGLGLVGGPAFFTCEEEVFGVGLGQDVEIVGEVHGVVDEFCGPWVARVGGFLIGEDFDAGAFAVFVAATVERDDDEVEAVFAALHPFHAVGGGFVVEFDGVPFLGAVAVFRWDEIEYGAAGFGVGGVPLGTDGDFAFAVAVDVAGGDADVVTFGEAFGDDVFFPSGVLIPDDLVFIGEEDVRFAVALDICDGEAVADLDIGVDGLRSELWGELGLCGDRGEGEEDGEGDA